MKKVFLAVVLTSLFFGAFSQNFKTLTGQIDIYSKTSLFTIEAANKKAACVLNSTTGEVAATVMILSFDFKEALVEEHFNENYMETTKEVDGKQVNSKATFSGKITDMTKVDFTKNGTYNVTFSGQLKIHNTTNTVTSPAVLVVSSTGIKVTTNFDVSLAAYNIKVEESYKDRINDAITLKIAFDLAPVVK